MSLVDSSPLVDEGPSGFEVRGRAERRSWAPLLLVALLGLVFLVQAAPWLGAPFGFSHDGDNAAVWGAESAALRSDPLASHLGADLYPDEIYAHHPPLIIWETAAAEAVFGAHSMVTRGPAWLGSLLLLGLIAKLLLDGGRSPTATAVGIAVVFGSPMFFIYGTMLDTPVTSLPFAVAVLIAWQHCRRDRSWPAPALFLIGCLAALSGWSTGLIAAVVALSLLLDREAPLRRRSGRALVAGIGIGGFLTLAWMYWAYGSLGPVLDQGQSRASSIGLGQSIVQQIGHLTDLMPLGLGLGGVGLVVALRARQHRPLIAVSLLPILGYALLFREGAALYDYWNIAILIPLSIGAATAADQLIEHRRHASTRKVLDGLAIGVATLGLIVPTTAATQRRSGLDVARLLHSISVSPDDRGPVVASTTTDGNQNITIRYDTRRPQLLLRDRAELARLAKANPSFPVLVALRDTPTMSRSELARASITSSGRFALVPADVALSSGVTGLP